MAEHQPWRPNWLLWFKLGLQHPNNRARRCGFWKKRRQPSPQDVNTGKGSRNGCAQFRKIQKQHSHPTRCGQTAGGFSHNQTIENAANLLSEFSITLNIVDRRQTEFPFPAGLVDPCVKADISSIRVKAEKQAPGMGGLLRVFFCQFVTAPICGEHSFFGVTEGGPNPLENGMVFPDFILINVLKWRPDKTTLIHEMIHATGLTTHDTDPESVFSLSSNRRVLKPEHAERFSETTFARRL